MSIEWNLHYAGWMIADGLPDRSVGEEFVWEVGFWVTDKLSRAAEQRKIAVPSGDYRYRVIAELLCVTPQACIIDFGLKVVSDGVEVFPVECKQGDYISGEITLGLIHGRWFPPNVPFEPLNRKWCVNAIKADLTPYVSHPEEPKCLLRDESRTRYEPVSSTSSVRAHDYILTCIETS